MFLTDSHHFDKSRNMEQSASPPLTVVTAAAKFAALGSEQRLHVLHTLVRAGPDGLTIGTLGERSGITGSTLTHHLKILAAADLVRQTKQGRATICAGADYAEVQALSTYLMEQCCADCPACEKDTHCHD
jgi:DNA-binding transcriptional ArsR family regulator